MSDRSAEEPRPRVIVFDVNETLSDMGPLSQRFAEVGIPEHVAATWFAGVLRDGISLAAAGAYAPFADIAAESLRGLSRRHAPAADAGESARHIMAGFTALDVHPDVVAGVTALSDLGLRLVTMSNGAARVAEALLSGAGIRDRFEACLSVDDAGVWKPAPAAYAYALQRCEVETSEAMLVAVHPWDTDGAARAGLSTAWINRTGATYPGYATAPTLEADSLVALADRLAEGGRGTTRNG